MEENQIKFGNQFQLRIDNDSLKVLVTFFWLPIPSTLVSVLYKPRISHSHQRQPAEIIHLSDSEKQCSKFSLFSQQIDIQCKALLSGITSSNHTEHQQESIRESENCINKQNHSWRLCQLIPINPRYNVLLIILYLKLPYDSLIMNSHKLCRNKLYLLLHSPGIIAIHLIISPQCCPSCSGLQGY